MSASAHSTANQRPRREGQLRITLLIDIFKHTGGMMMMLYYGSALRALGHHVELLTRSGRGPVRFQFPDAREVSEFTSETVPASDILLATGLQEVDAAHRSGRGKVVQDGSLTLWMPRLRFWRSLRMALKKRSWQKRIDDAEHVYRLPTHMIATMPHLKTLVETRYGRWFKGIETTNKVIALVKSRGLPVHYVRVSPTPFFENEKSLGVIDEFHENLKPAELAEVFRGSDIYISNSLESEGFGLPAMEAMCCGLPTILSTISSYTQFSDENVSNYAIFVPQRGVEETASALRELIEGPAQRRCELRENALRVAAEYEQKRSHERFSQILQQIAAS